MRSAAAFLIATFAVSSISAPAVVGRHAAPRAAEMDTLPPLARFLVGSWQCRGGTPAGRVLNGRVTFSAVLQDHWLAWEHEDVPPGRYNARSLWPTDTAAPLASVVYDNFGGARRFLATAWSPDSIVWMRDSLEKNARRESFTYRRVSDRSYWYAWHVVRPGSTQMVLGDSATCSR